MSRGFGRGNASVNAQVKEMLTGIAERLETRRPDEPLTATGRLAMIQATTMDPVLFRALDDRVPRVDEESDEEGDKAVHEPVLRKDFAVQVREIAEAM
ncbi:hypothetical protein [Streptomyces chartreusis]|uniref:hypothetical protein n=1 Tax=Streptomyces chartreusis TaxID=1969 RepID=UPI0033D81756